MLRDVIRALPTRGSRATDNASRSQLDRRAAAHGGRPVGLDVFWLNRRA
jgi:hypothetical protein